MRIGAKLVGRARLLLPLALGCLIVVGGAQPAPAAEAGPTVLVVNDWTDRPLPAGAVTCDVDPEPGTEVCTLRAALELAARLRGPVVVRVVAEQVVRTGREPLPVDGDVTVEGAAPGGTTLDGSYLGPVFAAEPSSRLRLVGLAVRHTLVEGVEADHRPPGEVVLEDVTVTMGSDDLDGGGEDERAITCVVRRAARVLQFADARFTDPTAMKVSTGGLL